MFDRIDHLVLPTARPEECIRFYTEVVGLELVRFGEGRLALKFGSQKPNVHVGGSEHEPYARVPTPGSLDLCFIARGSLADAVARFEAHGVPIEEGPVTRTGAVAKLTSIYVRDPDGNLIEVAEEAR